MPVPPQRLVAPLRTLVGSCMRHVCLHGRRVRRDLEPRPPSARQTHSNENEQGQRLGKVRAANPTACHHIAAAQRRLNRNKAPRSCPPWVIMPIGASPASSPPATGAASQLAALSHRSQSSVLLRDLGAAGDTGDGRRRTGAQPRRGHAVDARPVEGLRGQPARHDADGPLSPRVVSTGLVDEQARRTRRTKQAHAGTAIGRVAEGGTRPRPLLHTPPRAFFTSSQRVPVRHVGQRN